MTPKAHSWLLFALNLLLNIFVQFLEYIAKKFILANLFGVSSKAISITVVITWLLMKIPTPQ
ncbi:MAG: hypothetical protein CML20_22010 [Rheinheimera sp.]|nr:hypothetical protein [Rheinheimera sp.]|tara:strand:+ start:2599 stop:2784 length:186 start_codon:yes stop_codon:yes gene_type:complete